MYQVDPFGRLYPGPGQLSNNEGRSSNVIVSPRWDGPEDVDEMNSRTLGAEELNLKQNRKIK